MNDIGGISAIFDIQLPLNVLQYVLRSISRTYLCWLMAQILMRLALVPVKVNIVCDRCLNVLFKIPLVCKTLCTLT